MSCKLCKFFSLAVLSTLLAAPVSAVVIVDDDFTSAEGFVDGGLSGQPGWSGQDGVMVSVADSTATVTNAWLGSTATSGASSIGNNKFTVTFNHKYRNLASDEPTGNNLGRFGLTTESADFFKIPRLANSGAVSIEAGSKKVAGEMTYGIDGTNIVATNAELGFDFSGGPDDSDYLQLIFMATRTSTPDTWDVMLSLDNLDNPFPGGPKTVMTSVVNAGVYSPVANVGGSVQTDNLYAGFATADGNRDGVTIYPAGPRGGPLSGLVMDRVIFDVKFVPEPASMGLVLLGLMSLVGVRRR